MKSDTDKNRPGFDHNSDDESEIRDWIAVIENALSDYASDTSPNDPTLKEELERTLQFLRASLS